MTSNIWNVLLNKLSSKHSPSLATSDEIKSTQKAIALLRSDILKIQKLIIDDGNNNNDTFSKLLSETKTKDVE